MNFFLAAKTACVIMSCQTEISVGQCVRCSNDSSCCLQKKHFSLEKYAECLSASMSSVGSNSFVSLNSRVHRDWFFQLVHLRLLCDAMPMKPKCGSCYSLSWSYILIGRFVDHEAW